MWRYLDKSQKVLINLKKSRQISKISKILTVLTKILTQPSLDWKVSIFKILTDKKKVDLDMMDILDGFQKLVSTVEAPRLKKIDSAELKKQIKK
jgi:hypothetical protein